VLLCTASERFAPSPPFEPCNLSDGHCVGPSRALALAALVPLPLSPFTFAPFAFGLCFLLSLSVLFRSVGSSQSAHSGLFISQPSFSDLGRRCFVLSIMIFDHSCFCPNEERLVPRSFLGSLILCFPSQLLGTSPFFYTRGHLGRPDGDMGGFSRRPTEQPSKFASTENCTLILKGVVNSSFQ
jgi:hypothetical protein